jgi:hypothetical protein
MRGVTLIAIGGYGYLKWAVNQAASIKFHSPEIPIQLIVSKELSHEAQSYKVFDIFTLVADELWQDSEGRLFPAKLKTSFYDLIAFDEAIYFDVDGVTLKDITPLFEQKEDFVTDLQGVYDLSQGAVFNHLKWAKPDMIWFHFGLKANAKLPAINSSFLFIRKSEKVKALFDLAHSLLMNNPLPISSHWYNWGRLRDNKVSQPDELYFNVAMAMMDFVPAHEVAVYFRMTNERTAPITFDEIREKFYGIGLFGQLESNYPPNRDYYNREAKKYYTEKVNQFFQNNCEALCQTKFAVI